MRYWDQAIADSELGRIMVEDGRPFILGGVETTKASLLDAGAKSLKLVKMLIEIFEREFNRDVYSMAKAVGFSEVESQILDYFSVEKIDSEVLIRGDLVRQKGQWLVHEINIGLNQISGILLGSIVRFSSREQSYDTLGLWGEYFSKRYPDHRIAFVIDSAYFDEVLYPFSLFKAEVESRSNSIIRFCGHRDLKLHGDRLLANDSFEVDVIFRFFNETNISEHVEEYADILRAVKNGIVKCPFGPHYNILGCKGSFALLWEYGKGGFFQEEDFRFVEEFVPFTQFLTIENCKQAIKNKDAMVLKPNNLLMGTDVYAGREMSPDKWEKILEHCLRNEGKGKFVLQDFKGPEIDQLRLCKNGLEYAQVSQIWWALHVLNERFIGGFLRARPQ